MVELPAPNVYNPKFEVLAKTQSVFSIGKAKREEITGPRKLNVPGPGAYPGRTSMIGYKAEPMSNSPPQSAANYTEPRQQRLLGGVHNSPQKAYIMGSSSLMKKSNNLLRVNGANSSNLSNSHFGGAGASTTAQSVMHTQTDTKAAQYYCRPAKSELGFLTPNGGVLDHGNDNNSD
jgi:hypothetical protein